MRQLLTDERSLRAVEVAELYADNSQGITDAGVAEGQAMQAVDEAVELGADPRNNAAHCAALCLAFWAPAPWGTFQVFLHSSALIARKEQIDILACVFGVPHRQRRIQFVLDPNWRTTTALTLAQGIYDERAFDRLPILADALQETGCDSDDLLNHLRDPNATHVRGCWALDLVLGKE